MKYIGKEKRRQKSFNFYYLTNSVREIFPFWYNITLYLFWSLTLLKTKFYFLFKLFVTCKSGGLPQWVYRVDSCPDSNNISQWIAASKRLNCYNNLTSDDPNEQVRVYHCIPSSFLNESVEFCGRSIPISQGTLSLLLSLPLSLLFLLIDVFIKLSLN